MAMVVVTGFPTFRGGLLRYADSRGLADIIVGLSVLEEKFGERFAPPTLLLNMVEKNEMFYPEHKKEDI